MRRAARIDENQKQIVNDLRKAGRSVYPTHTLGKGFPDLVVGFQGNTYLIEVKEAKGKLTPDQEVFIDNWRGSKIIVVRSSEEALKATGLK